MIRQFTKKDTKMKITKIREIQIKAMMRYHYTFISMAETKFTGARAGDGECGHSTLNSFPHRRAPGPRGSLSALCFTGLREGWCE